MIRYLFSLFPLLFAITLYSQNKPATGKNPVLSEPSDKDLSKLQKKPKEATIDLYKIITLQKDTVYTDTSLTIKKQYEFNYHRKDLFGYLPFANEGQPLMVLDYGQKKYAPFPDVGYSGKHFNYLGVNDIKYYSVATPFTELYYKTVMDKGQSLDAFVTLNLSKNLNVSLAYKGLRSTGKYLNQLVSNGNFRFTSSYNTSDKRYGLNFHFTGQDLMNQENGGIVNTDDFESGNADFINRNQLQIYLRDAESFLKGKRVFFDHNFRINSETANHNLFIAHQFNYEYKFFEFSQPTITTEIGDSTINRFGESYVSSNIKDRSRYNRMYNKAGAIYENSLLGKFQFFIEDFRYNYYFDKVLILDSGTIPSVISDEVNTVGGRYEFRNEKWRGNFVYSNSVTDQSLSNLDGQLKYSIDAKNELSFQYQMLNKIPDHIYNLHQSSYVGYNWHNDFKNEKIKNIEVVAKTQWLDASLKISSLDDYLFFSNDSAAGQQILSPKQYDSTINYLSVKVGKEFKWGKFALDNTLLYQEVDQKDDILNVPAFVTRNTLYFTDYYFKKALYLQTGFTFNYFTDYFANDYNPIIAESFVQNQTKIGNFPMFDFFVNARIRQTRIFLIAEHFNSSFTGYNYYTAPNYPYRDFTIRFGLVWNFFR